MSEYQYVAFRAVDRPLTDRELAYAQKQSTRAEITRWSFQNEYHYGDFHGDARGLLSNGYDVHLHYANFGTRTIGMRLPSGLPLSKSQLQEYLSDELTWKKDESGPGGLLFFEPWIDPGELEDIWSPHEYLDSIVELRQLLVAGDLRPLYLLWLCRIGVFLADPDELEPPVPGGLANSEPCFSAIAEFYELDPLALVAASEGAPPAPKQAKEEKEERSLDAWLRKLDATAAKRYLGKLLTENTVAAKAEILTEFRSSQDHPVWPTATLARSVSFLTERTDTLRDEHDAKEAKKRAEVERRAAEKKERERQERMKEMVQAPEEWLGKTTKLIAARGTANYEAAADILADLREAVGGDEGKELTRQHSAHLVKKHRTLTRLKSALRKRGLVE